MNRFFLIFAAVFAFAATAANAAPSPNFVISQFQVAGGTANDEFIEIHNTSSQSVDLNGHRLVYRSASGTNDVLFLEWTTTTVVPAGGYFLIASTAYDGAATPNATYNPTTCSCSMSATSGGLAIRNGAVNTGVVLDSVAWGGATNIFVEGTATPAPAANASRARNNVGCQDTDNNNNDFALVNPAQPRNSSTAANTCGGTGGNLFASGSAAPNPVAQGSNVLLTVTVIPAQNPPSLAVGVSANLTPIGGASSQQFFDNGTNGDVTAGDNVFSYRHQIPLNATTGNRSVLAVAADDQARTATTTISFVVNAFFAQDNPLALGNPSNAVTDVNQPFNYLMIKPQYSLSYHRDRGTPIWTAWRLDSSWLGQADRQDDFRPDDTLPAGWYRVTDSDYSGSGYTRGHMTPSGDRTRTVQDNSATFLMTNMIPQTAANNNNAWAQLEDECRTLANQGNELYIMSGGAGSLGTIAGGRVNIPSVTWKVILVLPNGDNDAQRVTKSTRTIAVIMPNDNTVVNNWRQYRTSVRNVEYLTGFDFFSNLSKVMQNAVERKVDRQ